MRTNRRGDVLELATAKGLAYVQHVWEEYEGFPLVRLLPGTYRDRLDNRELDDLVAGPERYFIGLAPVASETPGVEQMGGFLVPAHVPRPPILRVCARYDRDGRPIEWLLTDGRTRRSAAEVAEADLRNLSVARCATVHSLKRHVETDWTPSQVWWSEAPEFETGRVASGVEPERRRAQGHDPDRAALRALRSTGVDLASERVVRHYLYLPDRTAAAQLAKRLGVEGYECTSEELSRCWALYASRSMVVSYRAVAATRALMESAARELGGEYDGWEADTEEGDE